MSASGKPTCGKWMPKAKATCARRPDHPGKCATVAAYVERNGNRPRKTARRRGVRVGDDPAVRARWRLAYKLNRYSLTPETFDAMLEAQGHACEMCHQPFKEDQPIFIDHDHACCPDEKSSCGRCRRGLLCLRCNTALGYIERYRELA
jgi:hypothetical protein